MIETRNVDGTISRTVYDTNGRGYITQNAHIEGSPATGSRSIYDSTGRIIRTEQLENVVVSIANGNSTFVSGDVVSSTSTVYDAAGQVIKKIDANGNVTQYEFDACGRNIATIDALGNRTEFTYDTAGRQLSIKDANGNTIAYEYDALGRKTKTVFPDGTYSTVKYNNLGQKIEETDAAGLVTIFEYNDAGQLSAVVKPEVNGEIPRWEYSYNQYGQRTSIKDPKGNVTSFTYDYAGRQLSRTLPMGQKETAEYNTFAQLVKQTDFKGQSVEHIYDSLGRKTAQKYFAAGSSSATEEITFTYDDLGRTKTIVTPQGTTENTYNARGELIQISTPEGSINYAYDVKTGAKTRVWTLNSDIRYTYDAMNRLKTVEVHKRNGVELGTPEVTTYDYTKVGSRASISLPNGITTSYQYDSLNRLTNLTHKKADTLIASYTYNLLPAGRRSAVTEVTPEGTSQINYTYDNLYRLTNETRTGVNPFTASYAYDINSNRTQKVETGNGITETINYEYNANDQLLSEVSSANGTTVYTYDVNGSLTNKANEGKFSYQYGYDLRNRLATANITRKEGTADVTITSSYAYNADGIRTRALQTINGITQNRYFLLDDGHTGYAQVFEETAELGGSIVRSYTIGDDVLSQTVAGVTSHLLYDGHGSTRQLADNNGAVTTNYTYDAYGKMLGGNPDVTDGKQSATDLLYAGEQFDSGLQMEYLRARYYDQDNGRFNRLDPFEGNSEDPQSLHKYAYAHCDSVNGIDPSGEFLSLLLANAFTFSMRVSEAVVKSGPLLEVYALMAYFSILDGLNSAYSIYTGYDENGEPLDSFGYAICAITVITSVPVPGGTAVKQGAKKLILRYKPGMNKREFLKKATALQQLAQAGKLARIENKVLRDRNVTRAFRNDIAKRIKKTFKDYPEHRDRLLKRLQDLHADHIQDLQLQGDDIFENLWLLDKDVNTDLGRQIWKQIEHLAPGEKITDVIIEGL